MISAFNTKPISATGAHNGVLPLGTGQAENGAAGGAFAIDVCFTVAKAVAEKLEESAKRLVFPTALDNVSGEHAEEDHDDQGSRGDQIGDDQDRTCRRIGQKKGDDRIDQHNGDIDTQIHLVERIGAIPSVHHSIKLVFEFTHNGMV